MALQIIWTQLAEEQLVEILHYWINRNRSNAYAIKLNELIDRNLLILLKYPNSGRKTSNKAIKVKVIKDYFVYYSYDNKALTVVAICDTRRDPKQIDKLTR